MLQFLTRARDERHSGSIDWAWARCPVLQEFLLSQIAPKSADVEEKFFSENVAHEHRREEGEEEELEPPRRVDAEVDKDRDERAGEQFGKRRDEKIDPRMAAHQKFTLGAHISCVED